MKSMFISPNCLMVECIIKPSNGSTQTSNPFGTQMQLQNRKVVGIESFSDQDLLYSPISSGNPVIPPFLFKGAFFRAYTTTIFDGKGGVIRPEGLFYDQIPLSVMRRVHNYNQDQFAVTSGGSSLFEIRPTELSWTKNEVIFPHPIPIDITYSAVFLVHYLDEGDKGENYNM